MVDCNALSKKVKESGISKVFIASKLGVTRQTVDNMLKGKARIDGDAIMKFKNVLHLTTQEAVEIFFKE